MKKKIFYRGLILILFLIISYFSIVFIVENLGRIVEIILSLIILGYVFAAIFAFGIIFCFFYNYFKGK